MSANVVNLRRQRKRRKRDAARTQAGASVARHGESKPARTLRQAQEDLEARRLEGHRREGPDDPE